jgi:GH24 family phage-related lysozyme (muramidase)
MVASTSERLTPFLAAHEGFVSRAYRCPAGVVTIGYGFTGRSKVFAEYWKAKTGHALRMGDAIGRAEADAVLTKMLAVEYAPPVARLLASRPDASGDSSLPGPPDQVRGPRLLLTQHAFDGATSVSFNCGPGALKWKWAQALGCGEVAKAAALLKNTAVAANGRRLAGLVRRRKEEAALIQTGDYGKYGFVASRSDAGAPSSPLGHPPSESFGVADVKQYQRWLKTLGYYSGDIDGDPGSLTRGAIENFQRKHALLVDGKVGPATRAALLRALDAKLARNGTVAGGGGAAAAGGATGGPDIAPESATLPDAPAMPDLSVSSDAMISVLGFGIGAALLVLVLFILWRNRGRFTGRRVPT